MTINLDPNLIRKFRDRVNEKHIFQEMYKNIDGKNKWNVICSAMDWITTTVEGLPQINLKVSKGIGHNALQSLNLMQYIISIDLLTDSIKQLFRVFDGQDSYPLSDDREIFKQSKISDDQYFKHIRAIFGTHPVNLNSLDGVTKQEGEKFYASWTIQDWIGDNDFLVYLYSNNPQKNQIKPFAISINDLNRYAEKRYELLHMLIDKVDSILDKHIKSCKETMIPTSEDPIEQLRILFEENKKRFGEFYGYSSIISYLYRLLKVQMSENADIDPSIVEEYRTYLISLIPIIKERLQNMDDEYIPEYIPWKNNFSGYEFEKIYSYLYEQNHPLGEAYFTMLIKKGALPSYLLTCTNFAEKELVFDAILYRENKRLSRAVRYEDLMNLKGVKSD